MSDDNGDPLPLQKNPRTPEKEMAGPSLFASENLAGSVTPNSENVERSEPQRSSTKQPASHDLLKQPAHGADLQSADEYQYTYDGSDISSDNDDYQTPCESEGDDEMDSEADSNMKKMKGYEQGLENSTTEHVDQSLDPYPTRSVHDTSSDQDPDQKQETHSAPTLVLRPNSQMHDKCAHVDSCGSGIETDQEESTPLFEQALEAQQTSQSTENFGE